MPVYSFQGIVPVLDPTSFLHPTASLIGDVIVGPGCYIGPGASLRGDFGRITLAGETSVQDNCTLHTSSGNDCEVARGATIGHGAVLHGCRIGENPLVGINSVVLDNADIGAECLVAALSLVRPDARIPDLSLVAGNPARVMRTFTPDQVTWRNTGAGEYQRLARESLTELQACAPRDRVEPGRPRIRANAIAVRLSGATARERERRSAAEPRSTEREH
ncbi:gamma carbonic anhydrase family protein [Xanthobacter wiegelii]|uniref:gamma carbonic anhydrase family protein n=1 Tax=Xanthobacter wiegelii TaxID=3119913 RepID=UPI00372C7CF4